jgi:hypothetical protein
MENLNQFTNAVNSEVVAKLGGFEYTRGELLELFGAVQNRENWKGPIDAFVDLRVDWARIGTFLAIEFFTGSRAVMEQMRDGVRYRVTADGYYATIGA